MKYKVISLFLIGWMVALPLCGQTSGIMPRRNLLMQVSARDSKTETPTRDSEPQGVEREIVPAAPDSVHEAFVFNSLAVDMLGFDKRMSDTKESFLLRNNTAYRLSRVVVKLIYRTPDGQMIDYRTRAVECDLLPHSTRRCEVESFDRSKNYYHVDSPPARVSGRPFKVTFQLLRYDVVVEP